MIDWRKNPVLESLVSGNIGNRFVNLWDYDSYDVKATCAVDIRLLDQ